MVSAAPLLSGGTRDELSGRVHRLLVRRRTKASGSGPGWRVNLNKYLLSSSSSIDGEIYCTSHVR